jgi:hypothetical protein
LKVNDSFVATIKIVEHIIKEDVIRPAANLPIICSHILRVLSCLVSSNLILILPFCKSSSKPTICPGR